MEHPSLAMYARASGKRRSEQIERNTFDRLKAELVRAFAAPEDGYTSLSAAEIIARNRDGIDLSLHETIILSPLPQQRSDQA